MDEILQITLEGGAARAMVAVTTGLVEKARQTHIGECVHTDFVLYP